MKYYEVLRNLRLEKGKKMKQVADDLHISPGLFGKYERGDYEPSYDTLIQIADYYGVSIDFLLRGEDKKGVYISLEEYEKLKLAKKSFDEIATCLNQIENRQDAGNKYNI